MYNRKGKKMKKIKLALLTVLTLCLLSVSVNAGERDHSGPRPGNMVNRNYDRRIYVDHDRDYERRDYRPVYRPEYRPVYRPEYRRIVPTFANPSCGNYRIVYYVIYSR